MLYIAIRFRICWIFKTKNFELFFIVDSDDYKSIHDDYVSLKTYVDSLSHEAYTTNHTPPSNQKDGDYWLEILSWKGGK